MWNVISLIIISPLVLICGFLSVMFIYGILSFLVEIISNILKVISNIVNNIFGNDEK